MLESKGDDLPADLDVEDLRYKRIDSKIRSQFEERVVSKGWGIYVDEKADDLSAQYVMYRAVPPSIDDGDVLALQNSIGIVDNQGELINGYGLFLHRLGEDIELGEDFPLRFTTQTNRLIFVFQGYPTHQTMLVLESLEDYKPPSPPGRWTRFLGYLGLNDSYMSD